MPTALSQPLFLRIVLYGLFLGSGFSALTYEVVWFHLLRLTVGSSQISLAILLVSFLGGMSIGSALFSRLCENTHHPIRVYAILEFLIGLAAIAIPVTMPLISEIYFAAVESGQNTIAIRSALCFLLLLPPTMMMGATLPAIARWTKTTSQGASMLANLYGANLAGAVLGVLVTGFVLLPRFDIYVATAIAVTVNGAIALAGFFFARYAPYRRETQRAQSTPAEGKSDKALTTATVLSGFTALGAQVIWTRHLAALIGATAYAFSAILSVFLTGLCIGSIAASFLIGRQLNAGRMFAVCQLLLGPAIALASIVVMGRPAVAVEAASMNDEPHIWVWPIISMLPATVIWGASFPLAIAAIGATSAGAGRVVGRLYAVNTIGAVIAVMVVTLWLVPEGGSQLAQQVLIGLAALSFTVVWVSPNQALRSRPIGGLRSSAAGWKWAAGGATLVAAVSILMVPSLQSGLVSYGRETHRWRGEHQYLHVAEGRSAAVAVSRHTESGDLRFHISGKVVASTTVEDMRLQRLLSHLPALAHPNPKSVLVVGLGAGVTAGAFVHHDSIERIVIVEIEPEVARAAGDYFGRENHNVLMDPRTEIIFDDARHYLATTDETFDIITADPIHPWVRGAAALYTKEFFELCRSRLNADGLVTQWVPLYESSEEAVKSELGTFLDVFPEGSIWNSQPSGIGYDLVLLGGLAPINFRATFIDKALTTNHKLRYSLSAIGFDSALDMMTAYSGNRQSVETWLAGFEINLDRNLRLEYLAGKALNQRTEREIYSDIVEDFGYPEGLFDVSAAEERLLRNRFAETYAVAIQ